MAADPVSRHNCFSCGNALEGGLAPHLCAGCGEPQPVSGLEDYFSALGAEKRFGLDRVALEKRFYEISRALHPDRFTAAGEESRKHSLERMSFVNQAYQTLRDPETLRDYIFAREGVALPKPQIPMELAEDWFEIQDMLMNEPDLARALVPPFEEKLASVTQDQDARISQLEAEVDKAGMTGESLTELAKLSQARTYLKSLARDVERIVGRFGGRLK